VGSVEMAEARRQIVNVLEEEKQKLIALQIEQIALNALQNTPGAAQSVQEITEALAKLEIKIIAARNATHQLAFAFFNAGTGVLQDFFTNGIDNAESFADAMRGLALSFVNAMRQIIAQLLAYQVVAAAFRALGLPVPAPAFATGGYVGIGPSGVDKVDARLTRGEYVITKAVVDRWGKEEFDRINFGRQDPRTLRSNRYATGGVVEVAPIDVAGGELTGRLDVAIDDGLLVRHFEAYLQTPGGQRSVITSIGKRPKAARASIGRG